jgi:Bacterial regulatory protein, Fis family
MFGSLDFASSDMRKKATPAFRVYSAVPRNGKADDWFEIGLAYPHADGRSLIVLLQAQPLNPKLLLHASFDKPREEGRLSLSQQVEAFERAVIERSLMETGGKINAVMELLGIPRRTLSEKIARLGIDRRRFIGVDPRNPAEDTASDRNRDLDRRSSLPQSPSSLGRSGNNE